MVVLDINRQKFMLTPKLTEYFGSGFCTSSKPKIQIPINYYWEKKCIVRFTVKYTFT